MTYPFEDSAMYYDYEDHRYILKEEWVLNRLNINLSDRLNKRGSAVGENVADNILRTISSIVYDEIYKRNEDNDVQEYLLAKDPSLRNIIRKAMEYQVPYFLTNGHTSNFAGIDLKNGRVIDIERLRNQSRLSPDAEIELQKPIKSMGVSILYQGQWNTYRTFDYEKDNY